jgi:hypothetical protein
MQEGIRWRWDLLAGTRVAVFILHPVYCCIDFNKETRDLL